MVRQDPLGLVDRRLRAGPLRSRTAGRSRAARGEWVSPPGGSGLNRERVTGYEPRLGQTLEIENEKFTGVHQVIFDPGLEETRITLEVTLEPKYALPPLERLMLRRRTTESLQRTLRRFSVELAAERQFGRRH